MKTSRFEQIREKTVQELRRGMFTIAVLGRLETPHYGYSLLEELNELGLPVSQDTLYPLLRRLEEQGFLDSRWDTDGPRPRRYYNINNDGRLLLQALKLEWESQTEVIRRILL